MIRECSACGQQNRIPTKHIADTGRCGACKATLPAQSEPIDADASTFDEIVRDARVPVLVDFWAGWCGPCRMAAPEVKRTASEWAGKALVLKVDTDRNPDIAARFNVEGIPNFVIFNRGKKVLQQAGLVNSRQMSDWLTHASRG